MSVTTARAARSHGATSPLRSRQAVRHFLEGQALTPADLSMVLLVTEEQADRPMPTVTVRALPAMMREARALGIRSVKVFAESTERDASGEFSVTPDALMARAVRAAKDAEPGIDAESARYLLLARRVGAQPPGMGMGRGGGARCAAAAAGGGKASRPATWPPHPGSSALKPS